MNLFYAYLGCFGFGLIFAVVSAIMAGVFGGQEGGHPDVHGGDGGSDGTDGTGGHAEAGFGSNDMPGFSPLSPTSISAFVTAFGGLGVILHSIPETRPAWASIPLATMGALSVAALVVWLFRTVFKRTQGSSEGRVATLAGHPATVITPLPTNGVGEIAYVQAGSRYTAPARSEDGEPIAAGAVVEITRIVGTQFFVTPR